MTKNNKETFGSFGCLALFIVVVGYFIYTFIRVDHPELLGEEFVPVTYSQAVDFFQNNVPNRSSGTSWEKSICFDEDYNQVECTILKSYDFSATFSGSVESKRHGADKIWCGDYLIVDSISNHGFSKTDCYVLEINPSTNEIQAREAIEQTDYSKYLK